MVALERDQQGRALRELVAGAVRAPEDETDRPADTSRAGRKLDAEPASDQP